MAFDTIRGAEALVGAFVLLRSRSLHIFGMLWRGGGTAEDFIFMHSISIPPPSGPYGAMPAYTIIVHQTMAGVYQDGMVLAILVHTNDKVLSRD